MIKHDSSDAYFEGSSRRLGYADCLLKVANPKDVTQKPKAP